MNESGVVIIKNLKNNYCFSNYLGHTKNNGVNSVIFYRYIIPSDFINCHIENNVAL